MYWSRDKQKCNGRAIVYQLKQRVFAFFDDFEGDIDRLVMDWDTDEV